MNGQADRERGGKGAARPGEESFRELLHRGGVALFDGAMGTMLYSKGVFIHRPFEELNLEQPAIVRDVHAQYVAAGAHVLESNTFAANRFRLAPHGLAEQVVDVNRRGVEVAREASDGTNVWVAGAMGPLGVRIEPFGAIGREEARAVFAQQARALHDAGVDLFVLETFAHVPELEEAVRAVRTVSDRPITAMMTVRSGARTREGVAVAEAAHHIEAAGAEVVGINCSDALATLDALEQMAPAVQRPLAAQPNAGTPRTIGGRTIYLASPEYLEAWGRRALRGGLRLLGGCCGTTPAHIRALAGLVGEHAPAVPAERVAAPRTQRPAARPTPTRNKSALAAALADGRFVAGVEIPPPRGPAVRSVVDAAQQLAERGADRFVSLPEGPLDAARLPPWVLAQRCARAGVDSLVHYACRGRRLARMQSELLGYDAAGVHNVLLVTGAPLDAGSEPDAPSDLEIDSVGVVNLATRLNHGEDVGGNPLGEAASLHVGVRLDPTAHDPEREVQRYRWKVEAGAEFAVTVPLFDPGALEMLRQRIEDLRVPLIGTIWPLVSSREAEFFEHELADVPVPEALVERMRDAEARGRAAEEGAAIAKELATATRPLVEGLLVVAPEGRTDMAWPVLQSLR